MGGWVHRLLAIDEATRLGACIVCGPVRIWRGGRPGEWRCAIGQTARKRVYRRYLRSYCARCGFVPEATCQMDVHHVNGNHSDNRLENLQTLCANCHRLVTWWQIGHEPTENGTVVTPTPSVGETAPLG